MRLSGDKIQHYKGARTVQQSIDSVKSEKITEYKFQRETITL